MQDSRKRPRCALIGACAVNGSNTVSFLEIDHEIIFMVQKGQLSVTGKSICTKYWRKKENIMWIPPLIWSYVLYGPSLLVFQGHIQRGFRGSVEHPFDSKFHFHRKFWINLEYHIYAKYSHPCSLPYTSL